MGTRIMNESQSELTFQAPNDWIYVGISGGEFIQDSIGKTKITCTCTGTGTCNPFIATDKGGSISGCAGDCTNCVSTRTIAGTNQNIEEGGYINLSLETRFVDIDEKIPSAFQSMFRLDEVNTKLNDFINQIYENVPYPNVTEIDGAFFIQDGYSFAVVSLCGRAISVAVPNEVLKINNAYGCSNKCECTKGVCKIESRSIPFTASITYCVGECTGQCTLIIRKMISDELTNVFESEFFDF